MGKKPLLTTTGEVDLMLLQGFGASSEEELLAAIVAELEQGFDPALARLYFVVARRVLPASRGRWGRVRKGGKG